VRTYANAELEEIAFTLFRLAGERVDHEASGSQLRQHCVMPLHSYSPGLALLDTLSFAGKKEGKKNVLS